MGTMRTFDKDAFEPTELVAPDGRPFTAETLSEYNSLVTQGYRVATPEVSDDEPAAEDAPAEATSAVTPDAQDSAPADAPAPATAPAADTETATPAVSKVSARRAPGAVQ